jgi:ribosomal protein L11 methyltransferase
MTYTVSAVAIESDARSLGERLYGLDIEALAIDVAEISLEQWQVVIYFDSRPSKALLTKLSGVAAGVLGGVVPVLSVTKLPEINWVAKSLEGLAPVHAGRFVVHGRHDRDGVGTSGWTIEIEAGQAFGTGHHGTTAACLVEIDRVARSRPIRNALDLGTGSGVLAIAIAKAAKARVVASDIDPLAAKIANENAKLNGVGGMVMTIAAAGIDRRAICIEAPFDLIVANILAGPLVALAPSIRRSLAPGGTLILSGLLPEQRRRIVAAYRGQGLRLKGLTVRDDWLTLVFERPFRRDSRPGPKARPLRG